MHTMSNTTPLPGTFTETPITVLACTLTSYSLLALCCSEQVSQHCKAQLVYSRVAALPAMSEHYPTTVKTVFVKLLKGMTAVQQGQTTVCKVCCFLCLSTLYSTTDPITMLAPTRKELKHNEMQRYYTS